MDEHAAEHPRQRTILCLASYEKGQEFMRECKRLGNRVILLTETSLEHADWPWESIDEFYHMPTLTNEEDVIKGVTYLARSEPIDRVAPMDDYDVQMAAALREHMRLPGLNASTARRFRDKLAMRVRARETAVPVPDFVPILNHRTVAEFMERVPGPWVLKPRAEASAIGVTKIESPEELWQRVNDLGDRQSYFLLERFIPGDVYHVDALVWDGKVVFAEVHKYHQPPMAVFHGGGIASSRAIERGSEDEEALQAMVRQVVTSLGMDRGVVHVEFIKDRDTGQFYFLETAARVGGANTVEMVEAATGINLWREWARIESSQGEEPYELPEHRNEYAGLLVSLARQEHPDMSAYNDPEIVYRISKPHHAGLVVASPSAERVKELLESYIPRFEQDFLARLPAWQERPPSHE